MVDPGAYETWVLLSNCITAMLGGSQPYGTRPKNTSSTEHLANRSLAALCTCLYWMQRSQTKRGDEATGARKPRRGESKVATPLMRNKGSVHAGQEI